LLARHGLAFVEAGTATEYEAAIRDPDIWNPMRALRAVARHGTVRFVRPLYEAIASRHVPGETVVVASSPALGARVGRDVLGAPLVPVHLPPSVFRSALAPPVLPLFPRWRVPAWWARFMSRLFDRTLVDPLFAPPVNEILAEHGRPPVRGVFGDFWH